jgi:hypothetical protein
MAQAAQGLAKEANAPGLMPSREESPEIEEMDIEGGDDHIKKAEGIDITSGAEAAQAEKHFNNGLGKAA